MSQHKVWLRDADCDYSDNVITSDKIKRHSLLKQSFQQRLKLQSLPNNLHRIPIRNFHRRVMAFQL